MLLFSEAPGGRVPQVKYEKLDYLKDGLLKAVMIVMGWGMTKGMNGNHALWD